MHDPAKLRVGYYIPAYRRSVDPGVWKQGVLEGDAAARIGFELVPDWDNQCGIDYARNRTLEGARKAGLDFLFMQDADTYADCAVIPKLIDIALAEQAEVVAIACALRRDDEQTANVYPLAEGQVYQAELAGTALMLIDVKRCGALAEGSDVPWFSRIFSHRGSRLMVGGDINFCARIQELGGKVVVDATFRTSHVDESPTVFNPACQGKSAGDDDGLTVGG